MFKLWTTLLKKKPVPEPISTILPRELLPEATTPPLSEEDYPEWTRWQSIEGRTGVISMNPAEVQRVIDVEDHNEWVFGPELHALLGLAQAYEAGRWPKDNLDIGPCEPVDQVIEALGIQLA
jgi:hypothetical protein